MWLDLGLKGQLQSLHFLTLLLSMLVSFSQEAALGLCPHKAKSPYQLSIDSRPVHHHMFNHSPQAIAAAEGWILLIGSGLGHLPTYGARCSQPQPNDTG